MGCFKIFQWDVSMKRFELGKLRVHSLKLTVRPLKMVVSKFRISFSRGLPPIFTGELSVSGRVFWEDSLTKMTFLG